MVDACLGERPRRDEDPAGWIPQLGRREEVLRVASVVGQPPDDDDAAITNGVAVCHLRAWASDPAGVKEPVTGSHSSAVARGDR